MYVLGLEGAKVEGVFWGLFDFFVFQSLWRRVSAYCDTEDPTRLCGHLREPVTFKLVVECSGAVTIDLFYRLTCKSVATGSRTQISFLIRDEPSTN